MLERHGRARCEKRYVVNGQQFYYRNHAAARRAHQGRRGDVLPVPERREERAWACRCRRGVIRVYQGDSKGGTHFVGEDRIDHTPKDETLDLKIGNAFDVVCERKQTDFEKIADKVYEVEFEITLRNHKDVPIGVQVRRR